ncbi:MAG TPA: ABC transporter permease [Bryobacteraceae bacterium]|nr:ABC transporter permease [Bryobacteraceae bacterium]
MNFPFRRRERELDDEIRSHLAMAARDARERGATPGQAHLSARREFGNVALVQEVVRDAWGWAWLDRLLKDLLYAARQLRANPAFTLSAVLTLALGIGANSAIFSVVNAVLLNSLPYPNAERLVWVWGRTPRGATSAAISPPDYLDYRERNTLFQHFGAFSSFTGLRNWSTGTAARQLQSAMVTGGLFDALGASPLFGRNFTRDDEQASDPHVAILSYRMWQEAYGGDPAILGRTARMDSSPITIVGVMPPAFDFPRNTDFWFPIPMLAKGLQQRMSHNLRAVGLLKPGATIAQAQASLDAIAIRLGQEHPVDEDWGLQLQPMREAIVGRTGPLLWMLLGAVGLVLLIACVNIANLLLARYGARQREISIRTAIGAGRFRILRQLLTENLLLALLAGSLALAIAWWGVELLRSYGPASLPRLQEVRLDGRVVAFTALVSTLTAVLFGLAPAWLATAASPIDGLREGGRSGSGRHRQFFGSVLVIGETALALCLVVGAGLLLTSLLRTMQVAPGFSPQGVLSTDLMLPFATYPDASSRLRFLNQLRDSVRTLPGVQSFGAISELPLNNEHNDTVFRVVEHAGGKSGELEGADFRVPTPGYFETIGIPLLRGRLFDERDGPSSPRVAMVDEPFARRIFHGEDPLGKHLSVYSGAAGYLPFEIVGIVGGIHNDSLQIPPMPTMYFAYAQAGSDRLHLLVRTTADPAALTGPIRRLVTARDPDLALSTFATLDHVVAQSVSGSRFNTVLLGLFATLALVLAMAGVYGVLSYLVAGQTHEIGVRMALGAEPGRMLRLILRRGGTVAGAGVVLGGLAACFLVRVMQNQLFEVKPRDPGIFAAAAAILVLVALAACWVPARRAMRVDPLKALRCE